MVFAASLLGAGHLGEVVENKPASSLVVSLARHLTGRPTFMWKTGGPVFPLKRGLVAGRASDRKNKKAML